MSNLPSVVPGFLRDLSAAVKATGFYPPDHPTVTAAVERAAETLKQALAQEEILKIGVGDALFLRGTERIGGDDRVIAGFATYLGRRGVGTLTFKPPVEPGALKGFLEVIAQEPGALRARGGSARCLVDKQVAGVSVEELDSAGILKSARTVAPAAGDSGHEESSATTFNDLIARFLTGQDPGPPAGARSHFEQAAVDPQAAREILKSVERLAGPTGAARGDMISMALGRLAGEVATGGAENLARLAANLRAGLEGVDPAMRMEILQASIPVAGTERDLAREIRAGIPDDALRDMIVSFVRSERRLTPRLTSVIRKVLIDAPDPERDRDTLMEAVKAARERGTDALADAWASIGNLLEESQDDWLSKEYKSLLEIVGVAGPLLEDDLRTEIRALPEFLDALSEDGCRRPAWLTFSDLLQVETEPAAVCEVLSEIETRAQNVDPDWYALAGEVSSTVRERLESWTESRLRDAASKALRRIAERLVDSYRFSFHRLTGAHRVQLMGTVQALGAFAVDPLLHALEKEEDWEIRKTLITFLVACGREALPGLTRCLASPSWFLVRNVLVVLGELGDASLIPVIAETLKHTEPRVRKEALSALGKIGGARAFALACGSLDDPEVAEVAIRAMGAINRSRAAAMFLERVQRVRVLGRRNKPVEEAIAALGELQAGEAIPHLRSILLRSFWIPPASGDPVRIAAARALLKIGAPEALRALERGARRGRRPVREACASVLARREHHA